MIRNTRRNSGFLRIGLFLLLPALMLACTSPPSRPIAETSPRTGTAPVTPVRTDKPSDAGKAGVAPPAGEAPALVRPPEEKAVIAAPDNLAPGASTTAGTGVPAQHAAETADKTGTPSGAMDAGVASNGAPSPDAPAWANGKEELIYRMEFLGLTMGYAHFTHKGKVSWNGKEAYHLSVHAWTSGLLSVFYPFDGTVDYYMDMKTLTPLRQEFTGKMRDADHVAVFDQEKGRIEYRNKKTGAVRNEVETPPNIYDPVTAAYYFRGLANGAAEQTRPVYAGRKLYQISMKTLGREKIDTETGPVDAVVVQTLIVRDGKVEENAGMKMWISGDARHVPVRIQAKFKKIKMWTMQAELVPPRKGG